MIRYFLFFYGIPFIIFRFYVTFIICKHWTQFQSSFYRLYLTHSACSGLFYLIQLFIYRLPHMICGKCLLSSFFSHNSIYGLEIFHFFFVHYYIIESNFFVLYGLNRLTALLYPAKTEKIWSYLLVPLVFLSIFGTVALDFDILIYKSFYIYDYEFDYYDLQSTIFSGTDTFTNFALYGCYSTLISFILVISIIKTIFISKIKVRYINRRELRLCLMPMIFLIFQTISMIPGVVSTFLPAELLRKKRTRILLMEMTLICYGDVLVFVAPICLLFANKRLIRLMKPFKPHAVK